MAPLSGVLGIVGDVRAEASRVLYIGIDEAGYGPLLGPLVIGAAALRVVPDRVVPDDVDGPEGHAGLARRLHGLIVRRPRDARRSRECPLPVPVDDSKRIHARFGLAGLARGVGAFAAAMGTPPPADLVDLLLRFSDRQPQDFAALPWFADLAAAPVPTYPWTGPLEDRFRTRGVQALDLRVLPLSAAELNADIARLGNKARVLALASGTSLLGILDRHPGEDAEVVFDRQGSRLDYAGFLSDLFPFAAIEQQPSPAGTSHYAVELPGSSLSVLFATGADRISLPVSWASMAAKLARELFMQRFNAYFQTQAPDVRPTAGYYQDGRRFLDDIAHVLDEKAEEVRRADLVRAR